MLKHVNQVLYSQSIDSLHSKDAGFSRQSTSFWKQEHFHECSLIVLLKCYTQLNKLYVDGLRGQSEEKMILYIIIFLRGTLTIYIWAAPWQDQPKKKNNAFATSMDLDQHAHPRSLIRIHTVLENLFSGTSLWRVWI
jgi:hypothetical protein